MRRGLTLWRCVVFVVGEVTNDSVQCMLDTCSMFPLESSADETHLRDGKMTFICLFKHARVQATSQLGWAM
jgi:hypothetical protein